MDSFKHNGKELNFNFNLGFLDIFLFELGNDFEMLSKLGDNKAEKSGTNGLKLLRDIAYSCAKSYSILNNVPFEFNLIEFTGLAFNKDFDANEFMLEFNKSFEANIPQDAPKGDSSDKKKLTGGK